MLGMGPGQTAAVLIIAIIAITICAVVYFSNN